jgi:large subunit ribosomal protein L25
MSELYKLTAETRTASGKAGSRRLRRLEDKIPAIIYGGEKDPLMVQLDHNLFSDALDKNEAFYSHVLTLSIGGQKEEVILKDLHRHPSKPRILHADFQRVSAKTKITLHVPLHFKGEANSPAVKNQGGVVSRLMTEIEVRCFPNELPEFIEVDLSNLAMGESILLSEIKLPKGVEVVTLLQGEGHDQPVASIHKPTVSVEPASSAAEEAEKQAPAQKPEG